MADPQDPMERAAEAATSWTAGLKHRAPIHDFLEWDRERQARLVAEAEARGRAAGIGAPAAPPPVDPARQAGAEAAATELLRSAEELRAVTGATPQPQYAGAQPATATAPAPRGASAVGASVGRAADPKLRSLVLLDDERASEDAKYEARRQRVLANEGGRFGGPEAVRALLSDLDQQHKSTVADIERRRAAHVATEAGGIERVEQLETERGAAAARADVEQVGVQQEVTSGALGVRVAEREALEQQQAQMQADLAEFQRARDKATADYEQAVADAAKEDPIGPQNWANRNAPTAILAGVAIALGSVQQMLTGDRSGVDAGLRVIDKAIDEEIRQQMMRADQKQQYAGARRSFLDIARMRLGDATLAAEALKAHLQERVANELETGELAGSVKTAGIAGRALTEDIRLRVEQSRQKMLTTAEMRRQDEINAIRGAQAAAKKKEHDAALARALGKELGADERKRYLDSLGLVREGSDVAKIRDEVASNAEQRRNFATLHGLLSKYGPGEVMSPSDRQAIDQLSTRIAMPDMIAAFGAGNEKQIEVAKGMAGVPSSQWTDRTWKDVASMAQTGAAITQRRHDEIRRLHVEPAEVTEIVDPTTGQKRVFARFGETGASQGGAQIKPGAAR